MKYYKDQITGEVYAYESDGSQDAFIKDGLIAISDKEADDLRRPLLSSPIPASVTMRQARLALLQAGLLDQVDAAITAPADKIEWQYATTVQRGSHLVQSMAAALNLTEQQLDDLFTLAGGL